MCMNIKNIKLKFYTYYVKDENLVKDIKTFFFYL